MEEESTRKIFPHWNSSVDRPTTLAHIIDVWWWYFPVTENSSHCFALHLDSTICSNTPTCSLWSQNWSSDDDAEAAESRWSCELTRKDEEEFQIKIVKQINSRWRSFDLAWLNLTQRSSAHDYAELTLLRGEIHNVTRHQRRLTFIFASFDVSSSQLHSSNDFIDFDFCVRWLLTVATSISSSSLSRESNRFHFSFFLRRHRGVIGLPQKAIEMAGNCK